MTKAIDGATSFTNLIHHEIPPTIGNPIHDGSRPCHFPTGSSGPKAPPDTGADAYANTVTDSNAFSDSLPVGHPIPYSVTKADPDDSPPSYGGTHTRSREAQAL